MKSIPVMQLSGYYLICYKPKTSVKFSSVQMKEKYLKLGLRDALQNNFISEKASHMLPRCTIPYVCSVRLIMEYMHL